MKLVTLSSGALDLALADGGSLVTEETLQSAVIVSLLTDRRAAPDDRLPADARPNNPVPPDRRGWVGDAFDNGRIGSRLWLLYREKQTEETRKRAIFYARESLQWLLDDGHVNVIEVSATWNGIGRLEIVVRLTLPTGVLETSAFIQIGKVYAV